MTEAEFIATYGHRPDTAAKRKAYFNEEAPASLMGPLAAAIEASGIPLSRTAQGWGAQRIFDEIRREGKRK